MLLQSYQKDNGITFTNSTVAIPDIKSIKIKRHAFFLGLISGAIVTGFAGYGVGQSSYTDDPLLSAEENKTNAQAKGFKDAAIGVLPGAVAGGLIGSAVIRRRFTINGDVNKIRSMVKVLTRYYAGKKNNEVK